MKNTNKEKWFVMKVLKTPLEVTHWKNSLSQCRLGFVPTMGGIHEGHLSLVKQSLSENTHTLVSIFLNPKQFNNKVDLKTYPQNISLDIQKLKELNVDAVLTPTQRDIYPDHDKYTVTEAPLSQTLCGQSRKGHFDGVLTVVLKLFLIVQPHQAYFGQKDYQQLELVQGLVQSFFLNIKIIACPTVREASGLALSSRNELLSSAGRQHASKFFQILKSAPTVQLAKDQLQEQNFKVDYVEEKAGRRYGAVFYENVRLIDNCSII